MLNKNQSQSNDREAIKAAHERVAICELVNWGVLQISGDDRLRFLHNQTTNDLQNLQPGEGCNTVFVTSTGRTLDLATAYVTEATIFGLVSPNRRQQLMAWMDRFIFPMDKVELADLSEHYSVLTLVGPESQALLAKLGIEKILEQPPGNHALVEIENYQVRLGVGSGLAIAGYTLIVTKEAAKTVWTQLTEAGAISLSDRAWEQLRIQQGRPVPDRELTEDYNPLEAGLWQAISFDKGCYIGQETIARLNTYKGVKQRLWGVQLSTSVEPGTPVIVDDSKIGTLTSFTDTENGPFGLAYVRTKAGGVGLRVQVGEASGELVNVPFLTHQYQE